jgi:hypothetical protein
VVCLESETSGPSCECNRLLTAPRYFPLRARRANPFAYRAFAWHFSVAQIARKESIPYRFTSLKVMKLIKFHSEYLWKNPGTLPELG